MKNIFIIVPSYDPDEKVMSVFIKNLQKEFENILIVDDGCNKNLKKYFKTLEEEGIKVFTHYKNYGKGRGLKNAFNYLLTNYPKLEGVVTCDSDGQHSIEDIKKCAELVCKYPKRLILGVRNFEEKNVPVRSKFGNKVTRTIFKTFIGIDITDTQTGLRGFSKDLMLEFSDTLGERYEYETNMLIECKEKDIPIKEFEIKTIYENNNEGSHFNPIKDSIRIYRLFLKFLLIAISSYLIDIIAFIILFNSLNINSKILASAILARIISSIYNYLVNSKVKFKNMSNSDLSKYYLLTTIQMFISGCSITYFYNLTNINVLVIKIIVDLVVWFINLYIQNEFDLRKDIK